MEAFHAHLKNVPHCCIQIILFFIQLIQWLCPSQVHWRRTVLLTRGPCWGFARAQAPQGESTNCINADSIHIVLNLLKWLLSIAWLHTFLLFFFVERKTECLFFSSMWFSANKYWEKKSWQKGTNKCSKSLHSIRQRCTPAVSRCDHYSQATLT